jgi:hypothetical protein
MQLPSYQKTRLAIALNYVEGIRVQPDRRATNKSQPGQTGKLEYNHENLLPLAFCP